MKPARHPIKPSETRRVVNQKVVALESGVSRSTVAAILAGGEIAARYSPETQAKVIETAARLNYQPSRAAQEIRKQRSNLIAIVHFGAGLEVVHEANLAISRTVQAKGYDYLAIDMNWHGRSVERTLMEIIRSRVEGVIISHIQEVFDESHIQILRSAGIPVVSVNGSRRQYIPLIYNDSRAAFREITGHLVHQGCRTMLMPLPEFDLHPPDRHYAAVDRYLGVQDVLKQNLKRMPEDEFFGSWPELAQSKEPIAIAIEQPTSAYEQLESPVYHFTSRVFKSGHLPDAIIASNDFFAMEVFAAALECGVSIPRDLALTGYDNDRMGRYPGYGLTTAEQNVAGICAKAVEVLQAMINDPSLVPDDAAFSSQVIYRTSSLRDHAQA